MVHITSHSGLIVQFDIRALHHRRWEVEVPSHPGVIVDGELASAADFDCSQGGNILGHHTIHASEPKDSDEITDAVDFGVARDAATDASRRSIRALRHGSEATRRCDRSSL